MRSNSLAIPILLVVFLAFLPHGAGQEDTLNDPLPIKRMLIPAGRLPAELEKVRQGVLLSMPRPEFEARVQKAARAGQALKNPPRLIKAEYRAVLDGNSLTNGRGEWTVLNPSAEAGILPLGDLNLALEKVKTKEDAEAVVGDLDGKSLGVLVEKAGAQPIFFDWTLRGISGYGGLQFELKVPPCALNILELTVPADHIVASSASSAILSGPHESEIPQQRKWRLHFAGRSQIDLVIRKKSGPGAAPLVLSQLQSRQQLAAGRCQADFDFRLEVLHGSTEQFIFTCDPGLEPYEVNGKNVDIKGWELQKSQQPGGKTLFVHLREPFQGKVAGLHVRCLAAVNGEGSWTSPGLRVRSGMEQGETLKLTLAPEVRLQNWQTGHFRLLSTSTDKDGGQTLTLLDSTGDKKARPGGTIKVQGVDFLARQKNWWQIGHQGSTLTADIDLEINRGKLFQLSLLLPTGWRVESVAVDPVENLGAWVVSGNRLLIDLQRALVAGMHGNLRVRLSSATSRPVPASGLILDFPDVRIVEPCLRRGVLAIRVNAPYQAAILNASLPAGTESAGPWKSASPQFFFPFKNEPVAGKLRLLPYRAKVQARCATDVVLVPGGAALQIHLDVERVQSNPSTLDLYLSAPLAEGWQWKTEANQVVKAERLALAETLPHLLALGARQPFELAGLQTLLPRGQRWRLVLPKPLEGKQRLFLQSMLKSSGPKPLEVPLVSILDAPLDGTVSLDLAGTELVQVERAGLREDGEEAIGGPKTRRFQYEPAQGARFPRLLLTSHPKAEEKNDREICDLADFTTMVGTDGRLLHQFRFRVWNWRQSSLPLVLPANTVQVLGARVDGRWLGQVPQQRLDGLHILLAVPPEGNVHHFEVLYAGADSGLRWPGWARLEAPAPKLPLAPLSLQQRWRLPVGMEPVESSFVCVTDPHKKGPLLSRMRHAWHGADPWLAAMGLPIAEDWATPQHQLMTNAEAAVRPKLSKDRRLGEALQLLAVEGLGGQATLVIDAEALQTVELLPASLLAAKKSVAPFWEGAGLIYVPFSGAPLLTTKVKLENWKARAPHSSFADDFAQAVTQAAIHGRDRSGSFRTLDIWLAAESANDGYETTSSFSPGAAQNFAWVEWQPTAGMAHPDHMVVVQRRALDLIGLVLAVIGTFVAWRLGSRLSRSWYYRFLVIWLAAGGLALVWAPAVFRVAIAWVSLPALVFVVLGYVHWLLRGAPRKNGSVVKRATTVAGLLLLTALALQPAAIVGGQQSYTVLLVPGADDEPHTALVPPELLKKLDELAGRGVAASNRPVLTKARYQGIVKGSTVEFQADLECLSFTDKSTLIIPLEGVDLKDGAVLNGRPDQFPVAVQAGYALPLTEKGFQKLTLKFSVRLSGTGPSKELRFSIPKLAQSQLELTLPKNAQEIQAVNALGDQRLSAKGDTQTLQARLGRENTVQVRWRSGSQAVPAAQIQVRELYYFDMRQPAPALNAILEYSVKKGILPGVSMTLPEGLEVRTVEVSSETSEVSKTSEVLQTPRLKDWRLLGKNGNRTLHIDFHQPVAGGVQVKLGLVPPLPRVSANLALELPFPLQVKQDGFLEGFLAYRLDDLEARESQQNLGAVGISGEVFSKAWRVADPRAAVVPTRSFSFRRNAPKAALLLALVSPAPQASQEITWQVGPQYADWTLACELTSQADNLMLVEWQIPPGVVLAEVSGPAVRQWSRAGALVQVWLNGPEKKTKVKLAGWTKNPKALAGGKGRFNVPALILKKQTPSPTTIHVTPLPGITLQPANLQNLTRSGAEDAGAFSFVTAKTQAEYGGAFLLDAAPVQADVGILTVSRIHNRALDFTTHLDCRVPHGEISQLIVQIDRWSGDDVNLEVLELSARVVRKKFKDGHSWIIHLPPGMPRHFSCRLTGRRDLPAGTKIVLPDVSVSGARESRRFLALAGSNFQGEPLRGLAVLKDIPEQLASWPAAATQILQEGSAWRITRADWNLHVTPRTTPVAAGVQVLLAEQEAALAADGRWIHQATFLLFAKGSAEVHLTLPPGSRLLALAVDDQPVSPRQKSPETLRLPLPDAPGPHWLRLRWQFQKKEENSSHPNLAAPTIQGIPKKAVQGTVTIPAGFDVEAAPPAADLMFHRAAAQLELSRLLGDIITGKPKLPINAEQKLADAQLRFAWYSRQAEIQATRSGLPGRTLTDLRQQNEILMRRLDKDKMRLRAEKQALLGPQRQQGDTIFSLPPQGPPLTWRSDSPTPPRLILTPRSEHSTHNALVATEVLLLILVALGILSCLPRTFAWLPKLWPEQLIFLAWLGWYFFDISAFGLALMLIAVSVRVILTATWLQRLVHRTTPPTPGTLHAAN